MLSAAFAVRESFLSPRNGMSSFNIHENCGRQTYTFYSSMLLLYTESFFMKAVYKLSNHPSWSAQTFPGLALNISHLRKPFGPGETRTVGHYTYENLLPVSSILFLLLFIFLSFFFYFFLFPFSSTFSSSFLFLFFFFFFPLSLSPSFFPFFSILFNYSIRFLNKRQRTNFKCWASIRHTFRTGTVGFIINWETDRNEFLMF